MKISFEIKKMRTRGYFAYCPMNLDLSVCGDSEQDVREKIMLSVENYMQENPELNTGSIEISAKVIRLTPQ